LIRWPVSRAKFLRNPGCHSAVMRRFKRQPACRWRVIRHVSPIVHTPRKSNREHAPPFREGLPMASRHGAIIWAGRSGPRLRYGILNNDHIAELLATRCCFSLRALRRLGSKLCSVQWKDLSRSCNTAFCGSGQAKDRGWEPHRASRNGSYPDANGRVCSGAKAL
jgi:hypothetical protein